MLNSENSGEPVAAYALGGEQMQLGRALHAPVWYVPDVRLSGTDDEMFLEWQFRNELRQSVTKLRDASQAKGALDAFLELRNATPQQILNFVQTWGVLGLCGHWKPFTHNHRIDPADPHGFNEQPCLPTGKEPIAHWREFASEAFKIVYTTAKLLGAPALSHVSVSERPNESARRRTGWNKVIGYVLRHWLDRSAVRWTLLVAGPPQERTQQVMADPRRLQMVADCPMLFDVLAFQLAQAVTRGEGLYICAGCNQPFFRNWRASKGQRVFCRDCGKTARMRIYMREKRRKVRDGTQA